MESPAAPAPPAAESPSSARGGAQRPGTSGWRECLRPLRGALPPDVGRETAELAALAGPVFLAQLLTFLISLVSSVFCGHLGKVELDAVTLAVSGIIVPQAVTGIAANARNVGTNALLRCALDFGVAGSAWANTTSQSFLSAFLFLYVWWKKIHVNTWGGWSRDCLQEWGSFVQLAVPSVVMVCIEWWTSEAGTFLAGSSFIRKMFTLLHFLNISGLMSVTELGARAVICVLASVAYTRICLGEHHLPVLPVCFPLPVRVVQKNPRQHLGRDSAALVSQVTPIFAPFHLFDALAAQVRAGLRGTKEAVPTAMDLSILEKGAADGVILPDVIRPESQSTQLVAENSSGVATTREVLTGTQLLLYRGLAVVLAFAVPVAGILIRVFTDRG